MRYQPSNTITLNTVDLLCFNGEIPENREPHTGIFSGCIGDLENVTYLGESITVRDVEEFLFSEYMFRDIAFPTYQEFSIVWRNTWNRYFLQLSQNLENVEDFTVIDSTEKVTEDTTGASSFNNVGGSRNKYSNVPNQYIESQGQKGLTDYSELGTDSSGKADNALNRKLEIDRGGNKFERWLEISTKNRNLVYDFIDKFDYLFLKTFIIRSN